MGGFFVWTVEVSCVLSHCVCVLSHCVCALFGADPLALLPLKLGNLSWIYPASPV